MTVAETILTQLGGNKFIAMTGARNFVSDGNNLKMELAGNKSRANRLETALNGLDLYDMAFTKVTLPKFNAKTGKFTDGKETKIANFNGVMFDQLQSIFTKVTGMDTHL